MDTKDAMIFSFCFLMLFITWFSTVRLSSRGEGGATYNLNTALVFVPPGSPAASPDSSDNSDTQHSGGSDMEMDDQMMSGSKRSQQRLSDTEVNPDTRQQQLSASCFLFG